MPEIVFDCCVLSNFAFLDSLFILKALYGKSALITDFVSAEVMRGIQSGHTNLTLIQDALGEGWLRETSLSKRKEKSLFQSLSVSLGLGEASSIAVAKARKFLFACDDKTARREARFLGVAITGTLGILRKALRIKVTSLKNGDRILAEMKAHGYFSVVDSLKDIPD